MCDWIKELEGLEKCVGDPNRSSVRGYRDDEMVGRGEGTLGRGLWSNGGMQNCFHS